MYGFLEFHFSLYDKSILNPRPMIFNFTNILRYLWSTDKSSFVKEENIMPFRNLIGGFFELYEQHDALQLFQHFIQNFHKELQEPLSNFDLNNQENILDNFLLTQDFINKKDEDYIKPLIDVNNELPEKLLKDPSFKEHENRAIDTLWNNCKSSLIYKLWFFITKSKLICNIDDKSTLYKIQYTKQTTLMLGIPKTPRNYWKCAKCQFENLYTSSMNL